MNFIKQRLIGFVQSWCVSMLDRWNDVNRFDSTTVQAGDIVWALMPLSQEQLLKVPPGHRIRPFLIIETGKEGCKSYACSSQSGQDLAYYVSKENYPIRKSTYIDVSKQWSLPYENMQSHFFHLSDEDFDQAIHHTKQKKKQKVEFGIGTILKQQGSLYVIYQIEKEQLYAHQICTQEDRLKHHDYQAISIYGTVYYVDFTSKILLQELKDANICIQLNPAQKAAMKNKEQELIKKHKKQTNYADLMKEVHTINPIGTMFYDPVHNEELIYLFHRKGRCYGCYLDEADGVNYILRRLDLTYMRRSQERCDVSFLCDLLEHLAVSGEMKLIVNALLQQVQAKKVIESAEKNHNIALQV